MWEWAAVPSAKQNIESKRSNLPEAGTEWDYKSNRFIRIDRKRSNGKKNKEVSYYNTNVSKTKV